MPIPAGTNNAPIALADDLKARLRLHQQFSSKVEEATHDFIVYLPPAYEGQPGRRFPVLYMQDGQNLFDPETSFARGNYWRMGETADALIAAGDIERLIIVGIYNAGENRIHEYTHVEDRRLGGGQADVYGQMLVEELKPFIDRTYRTLPGAANCGLGGSSLGGLVTLYLGLRYSRLFSKLAVMSPSVWWRNRAILKTVAQLRRRPDLKIWLDIGTKEGQRALPDARELNAALVKKGWVPGRDLSYLEVPGAEHTESAWAERVAPMLKFLFPAS
ncbi:MAG TPA: alpha/beta hydrolase-fold protein [Candidatus Binatia bacterium]|nr:alpha/beta hydrolase-fold protein [Candidatus Binatia bacterium]